MKERTISTEKFTRMLDRYRNACERVVAEGVAGTYAGVKRAEKDRERFRLRLIEWAVEAINIEEGGN